MIPSIILEDLSVCFQAKLKCPISVRKFSSVGGGCINHGGKLSTDKGNYFLKWNSADRFPGMFEAEAKGLNMLNLKNIIKIPSVILTSTVGEYSYLVMEYIESEIKSNDYWETLGHQLADLHRNTAEKFGLDHDNYIGSLHQSNTQDNSWIEFFIGQRINPQLKVAIKNQMVTDSTLKKFDKLFEKMNEIFPEEKPSLIHGDLWSGNLMTDDKGKPCLIDPAIYYGFREMDLAMTTLFGGFDNRFYDSYQENHPLEKNWNERFQVCNLYPLLVHVNLFGAGYLASVESILKKFD